MVEVLPPAQAGAAYTQSEHGKSPELSAILGYNDPVNCDNSNEIGRKDMFSDISLSLLQLALE